MTHSNFLFDNDEILAIENLRRFLDTRFEPVLKKVGTKSFEKAELHGWLGELANFGLLCAPIPSKFGGLDQSWKLHLRLFEEVVYTSVDLALPVAINTGTASLLANLASAEIAQRYVPGLIDGSLIGCVGISEPDVGSDVAAVKTKAVRKGDDWVISGEKTWITNGGFSDFFVCTCRTGENELSHILIDRKDHGYVVREIEKMALNSQSTAQIFLDEVRVPITNTIGDIGGGLRNTMSLFERARVHMAAWGYGLARRALEESIKYAQQRHQHGRLIAGHQLIAAKIAVMATQIDAARLLAMRAASMIDAGMRCDAECAMAKWYGTEIAVDATRQAIQIHGGNGVTTDFLVERLAREAIISPIPDGTTEIQKLLIARSLTGISAFQ